MPKININTYIISYVFICGKIWRKKPTMQDAKYRDWNIGTADSSTNSILFVVSLLIQASHDRYVPKTKAAQVRVDTTQHLVDLSGTELHYDLRTSQQ